MKFILLAATALISLSSCGQNLPESKVPSVVQNTVKAQFAQAAKMEWEKKKSFYEAEFKIDSIEYTAHVDNAGKILLYKMDIPETALPAAISSVITKDHAGYTIDDVEKLEKDGMTYYQVELESKGKKDKELVFLADGTIAANVTYVK